MKEDIKRLIRHVAPVAVVYAVNKGWIPEEMQNDVIEIAVIASGIGLSLIWSRSRDKAAGRV